MKLSTVILAATIGMAAAQSMFDPISAKGTYTTLLGAIDSTGGAAVIEASAPVTVFGPKDSAFAKIATVVANLTTAELTGVLLNHVIADANVTSAMVVEAGCLEVDSAGELKLGINWDADTQTATVNGVTISDFDVAGDYGILHGIDDVLIGDFVPCPAFEADFSPIAAKGNYATLLGALELTGGDAAISANAPVTIFGPKDAAFAAIQSTVDELSSDETLAVLLNHVVVAGEVDATTVTTLKCVEATTAGGTNIAVRYNETTQVVDVNGIVIDDFDIEGDYGIMHGMNGVLLGTEPYVPCPTPTLTDQVALEGAYNTLLGFLADPTLQETLDTVGPITIFGPTDAAFDAVDLSGFNQGELITALGGHVVAGVYTAADVKAAKCVILDTVSGSKVRAMYMEGDHDHDHRQLAGHGMGDMTDEHDDHDDHGEDVIMINNAHVVVGDIADDTSIFHGIDEVILPSDEVLACPTEAPVAAPSVAPAADDEMKESSAASSSFFLAAVVALAAFAF